MRVQERACLHVRVRVMQVCSHRATWGRKNGEGQGGERRGEEREFMLARKNERACACLCMWARVRSLAKSKDSDRESEKYQEKENTGERGKDGESVCVRERDCVCVHVRSCSGWNAHRSSALLKCSDK